MPTPFVGEFAELKVGTGDGDIRATGEEVPPMGRPGRDLLEVLWKSGHLPPHAGVRDGRRRIGRRPRTGPVAVPRTEHRAEEWSHLRGALWAPHRGPSSLRYS